MLSFQPGAWDTFYPAFAAAVRGAAGPVPVSRGTQWPQNTSSMRPATGL